MNIQNYLVKKAPRSVYYIPNFVTEEEEKRIIDHVNSAPKPKWTQLSHRRLQNWGGIPHVKGMIAEKLPDWLQEFTDRIGRLNVFGGKQPNHVLVNEYVPGQGIMPHFDGPLFYPTVTTISCGSHTLLDFHRDQEDGHSPSPVTSLLLEQRSLVVLQDDMYLRFKHSIAERDCDVVTGDEANLENCSVRYTPGECLNRSTRISLTVRHVPRTSRVCLRLGR